MKVLHVMSSVAQGSGVAQVVMSYYRRIREDCQFDFLVFYDSEKAFDEEIESYGGKIYVSGKPGVKTSVEYYRWVKAFFKEHTDEYEVIQLHELYMNMFILPLAKRYGGIKVRIAHSHATKASDVPYKEWRNKILNVFAKKTANVFFACSMDAGESAFGNRICKSANFYLIKNAIDYHDFSFNDKSRKRIRENIGCSNETIVIGNVGRLAAPKNHAFLIKVFLEILKRKEQSVLVLIGEGPLEGEIRESVESYEILDKVIFTGTVTNVSEYLSAMDVFVLPSHFEGLGKVLIEAQCNGVTCVASDVVPEEAFINPNCHKLSLNSIPEEWADFIIGVDKKRICDTESAIIKNGYDINVEAIKLMKLYSMLII